MMHAFPSLFRILLLFFTLLASAASSPSSFPLSASPCGAIIDPIGMMRYGGDFLSYPLPSNATLSDCVALCCQTSTCLSFSFNDPQPETTFVGGLECSVGSVCCMLKGTVPALNTTNPFGASVRTGVIDLPGNESAPAPGPTPPFPPSSYILDVAIGEPNHWTGGPGDTWPTTWTSSGQLYGWACDTAVNGTDSPMGFFELQGDPYAGTLEPVAIAADPIDWMNLCAPYHPGQYVNVKPGGILDYQGTLYTGVTCITYGQDSDLFTRQHNLAGFIVSSTDGGRTWANVTAVGAFPGRFAAITFTQCGPSAPCPDPDSSLSWFYVFFTGSSYNDFSYWENGDEHFLARVSPSMISNPAAYQYYAGMSGGAPPRPQWSPDATQAQPILEFGRMMGQNAVHYNAFLGRWLIANYGFLNTQGNAWPWHQLSWTEANNPRRTQLLFLEAPNPWGPWTLFHRDDDAGDTWAAQGLYGTTFPALYHRPIANHKAEMILFFSCGLGNQGCYYTLNWVNITLTIAGGGNPATTRREDVADGLARRED